jgi:hypothetical protein
MRDSVFVDFLEFVMRKGKKLIVGGDRFWNDFPKMKSHRSQSKLDWQFSLSPTIKRRFWKK